MPAPLRQLWFRLVLALAAACGLVSPLAAHGNVRHDFKWVHGLWWDGAAFRERTVYSVAGELRDSWDGPVEATIDLAGAHVVPPLADAHNHGLAGFGDTEPAIREALRAGIYYFENPNNLASFVGAARALVNQPRSVDVVYANGGLTAPGGHPAQIYDHVAPQLGRAPAAMDGDAYVTVADAAALEARWPAIVAAKPDFLKVYLVHSEAYPERRADPAFYGRRGLDPALLPRIVERAHAAGLRVVAHAESAADFRAAVAARVDQIAHLPLEPLTAEDARAAAAAGVTVVTTTLGHWDTHAVPDLDALHRANIRLLNAAGVHFAVGTDGPKTALDEIDNLRRLAVFDEPALLRLAVTDTARAIFPGRRIGCLEAGCEASFLVLEGDPLTDPAALRHIGRRVKQGFVLELRPQIASALEPLLQTSSGAAIVDRYRQLVRDSPAAYEVSEQQVNQLGYRLLSLHRAADAAALMRLNAELYPGSANAWDSLAEVCAAAGDAACTKSASERVLELLRTDDHLPEGLRKALGDNARKRIGQ